MNSYKAFILNFEDLTFIDTLSISLLFHFCVENSKFIQIVLPGILSERTSAVSLLVRMGFFKALKARGISLTGSLDCEIGSGANVFQTFDNEFEIKAYEKTLSDGPVQERSLLGDCDSELITSGALRDILLHELGENAFLYGEGRLVRMLLREIPQSENQYQSLFFRQYKEGPVLEFVISDNGPGLVNVLGKSVPSDWRPKYSDVKKLSKGALVCAYSIEYYTTSNLEKRKNRIASILNDGADFAEAIPTGLYHVASQVKKYGGQLVFRTDKNNVSIDFRDPAKPIITENPIGIQGSSVRGTHVMVRILKDARPQKIAPKKVIPWENVEKPEDVVKYILLNDLWIKTKSNTSDFIEKIQAEMESILQNTPLLSDHALVLISNGLCVDTKTFSMILWIVGNIPHRGWRVVFGGLSDDYFKAAEVQRIKLIQSLNGLNLKPSLHDWQDFWLLGSNQSDVMRFSVVQDLDISHGELFRYYRIAIKACLAETISRPPICYPEKHNKYYLIEGSRYTQVFYEIRQVASQSLNPQMSLLSVDMVEGWVTDKDIGLIVVVSPSLAELSKDLDKRMPDVRVLFVPEKQLKHFIVVRDAIQLCRPKRCLILSDVICTGSQFDPILKMIDEPKEHIIGCFVDGRDFRYDYFNVPRANESHSVPVLSVLKTKILSFGELKNGEKNEIVLIDPVTHAPASLINSIETEIDVEDLIGMANESSSIRIGHFSYEEKHYSEFLDLSLFFSSNYLNIENYWNSLFNIIKVTSDNIEPGEITVLYYSDGSAWEYLLQRYMSVRGVKRCAPLTKYELDSASPSFIPASGVETIMFVLPVIVSGEIFKKCLEYALKCDQEMVGKSQERKSPNIIFSVLISRMIQSELSFHQGVLRFRQFKVTFSVFASWPSSPHMPVIECSICRILQTIENNLIRLDVSPGIRSLVEKTLEPLEIVELKNAGSECSEVPSGPNHSSTATDVALMVQLDTLFRRGITSVESRKKLTSIIRSECGKIALINMLGCIFDQKMHSDENITRTLYKHKEALVEFGIQRLLQGKASEISLSFLLGLKVLDKKIIGNNIDAMIFKLKTENNMHLAKCLLVLAALEPEYFGRKVVIGFAIVQDLGCPDMNLIRNEMIATQGWLGKTEGTAVTNFEEILQILNRSTMWGTGIENLSAILRANELALLECLDDVGKFDREIKLSVLPKILLLKTLGEKTGIWNAITVEGGNPEVAINSIYRCMEEIHAVYMSTKAGGGEKIVELLSELDRNGRVLLKDLHRLFSNARNIIARSKKLPRYKKIIEKGINVEFSISDDFPGILFGLSHLMSIPSAIFENADDYCECHKDLNHSIISEFKIRFTFRKPFPESPDAILEISDNIPYDDNISPAGGLKQVEAYCKTYGTIFEYFNGNSKEERIKFRYLFRTNKSLRSEA